MPDAPILDQLLEAADLLQRDMAAAFSGTALTPARTHLLWAVHHNGTSTQQALATVLRVSARNITGLVDALEDVGYVERQPHPTDRRATLVALTELGTQTMNDMEQEHRELSALVVADLDGEQIAQLSASLAIVTGRLRALMAEHQDKSEASA